MKSFIVFIAVVMTAAAFAQESRSGSRSPEQIFQFLDRDGNGSVSEAEFVVLKDRMPSLRQSPEAVVEMFQRLDRDGNGSLSLEEYRALPTRNPRRPMPAPPAPEMPNSPVPNPPEPMAPAITGNDNKPDLASIDFFEKKIRPVLVKSCYECHSAEADTTKGGLALDTREGTRRGGDSGPAVVPGDLSASLLMEAIGFENKDFAMPPQKSGGKLPDAVIRDFEEWVKMGAPDPRDGAAKVATKEGLWEVAREWWAWQPPARSAAPEVADGTWPKTEIDRFLLSALEEKDLTPVGDASKLTLLRRVTFDLTGLPPTPEEVSAFYNDSSPEAFQKVVNRLLDSPQFGKKWGRHWLDVARYAESTGKEINLAYPHAWRYRDYVIEAFNSDKPYDQFLREQLAGDLLSAKDDAQRAEQLVATGFLTLGTKSVNEANPRQFALDLADEQIDTVTQAFLGVTASCARCHDHKFDPIPQREYYSLAGIFLSTDTRYGTFFAAQNRNPAELIELPTEPTGTAGSTRRKTLTPEERRQKEETLARMTREADDLANATFGQTIGSFGGRQPRNQQLLLLLRMNQIGLLETELASYDEKGNPRPLAMGVLDQPVSRSERPRRTKETPRYASSTPQQAIASRYLERYGRFARPFEFQVINDSPVFARGEVNLPGEKVPRGFLSLLTHEVPPVIPADSSGRLELAEWMLAESHPLTARVMVNRVWQWLFGQGLVKTPDNFGTTGGTPANAALLDTLAVEFRESGWSVKKLLRELVLSRAYQLSSNYDEKNFTADPENELIWRMNKRRLDAESIRDAILVVSGQLDSAPQPGSPIAERGNGPIGEFRQFPDAGVPEDLLVEAATLTKARSVYLPIARGMVPDALAVFDFAEPGFVNGRREVTNVPAQALYMLNSPTLATAAQMLAERVLTAHPASASQAQRVQFAYGLVFARAPSEVEQNAAADFFAKFPGSPSADTIWTSFCRALLASAEFRYFN